MPTNKKSSSSRKKCASRSKSKSKSKSKPRSRSTSRSKSRSRRSTTKHVTRRRGPIVIKPEHPIPIDLNIPRTSRAPMPTSLTPDELKKVSIGQLSQIAQEFGIQIGGLTLEQVVDRIVSYQ